MGYKFKPNKGVAKRMRVSKTGKIKHRHEKNSHHRSGRSASLKRRLGRAGVLAEGHSKNMRKYLGIVGVRPKQIAAERELAAKEKETATAEK
jgi:large subunit ribosomal protein L35